MIGIQVTQAICAYVFLYFSRFRTKKRKRNNNVENDTATRKFTSFFYPNSTIDMDDLSGFTRH